MTLIIAEAGVNHNGSLSMAKELVDVAKEAGADIVKFQTFISDLVVTDTAAQAEYQIKNIGSKQSQLEMIKKFELSFDEHTELKLYCDSKQIEYLSSPFDLSSLDFLINKLRLKMIKLPSGEIKNAQMLLKIAQSNCKIILSSGMCTLDDIRDALGVLLHGYLKNQEKPSLQLFRQLYANNKFHPILNEKVKLLQCTTSYPAPFKHLNLNVINTLREEFKLDIGFSDHSEGIEAPIAAVALGAQIIEKHFTLDRKLPGPDHLASLNPDELKAMVLSIRKTESALGSRTKTANDQELEIAKVARRSLIAKTKISKGERFNETNLTSKRPGGGISAIYYFDLLDKKASRDYQQNEILNSTELDS